MNMNKYEKNTSSALQGRQRPSLGLLIDSVIFTLLAPLCEKPLKCTSSQRRLLNLRPVLVLFLLYF